MALQDIDIKNALTLYAQSNGVDLSQDSCWRLIKLDGSPTGDRTGYTSMEQVQWNHASVVKPSAAQLETLFNNWVVANTAAQTTETTINTAQTGLKTKIALAEQFAPSIAAVLNASLQQTEDATTQPTRYNNIKAVMDAQPAAFRNRFNTDLQQETGIIIGSILPADFPNYCRYLRQWSTQLSILLIARKAL